MLLLLLWSWERIYKQLFGATKSSLEQQLTAVSNLIFVEKKSKIDKNGFKPSHIKGCMVLSFRHQLEKTGKKMEKSGKNRYILTLTRAFIFINILAILVESERKNTRRINYIPLAQSGRSLFNFFTPNLNEQDLGCYAHTRWGHYILGSQL